MQVRALSDRFLVWKRVGDSGKGEMAEEGVCEKTGALLPTDGKDSGALIHAEHVKLQKIAACHELPIIGFAADGASSEQLAQTLMDGEASEEAELVYVNEQYGMLHLGQVYRENCRRQLSCV